MTTRMRIPFPCAGHSARSQMAEGFARQCGEGRLEVHRAGAQPTALHPLTVEVMREDGIDVSGQYAKGLQDVRGEADLLVTVCDQAAQACPVFAGSPESIPWPLPDPAAAQGALEER